MRRTGFLTVAGFAACAALAAGCSGNTHSSGAGQVPAGSPSVSAPGSSPASAHPTPSSSAAPPQVHQDITELTRAVQPRIADDKTARISTDLDLAGNKSTGGGVIRYDGNGRLDLDVGTALPDGTGAQAVRTRLVAVGQDTYANFAPANTAPAQWIRLTPNSKDMFTGLLDDLASSLRGAADPQQFLTLAEAGGRLTGSDRERVGDADTVKYAIQVDVAKAQRAARAGAVATELLRNGVQQLDFQLWVGAADRPVRLASSQNLPQFGPVSGKVEFQQWGQPVQISAPPPDQVTSR